MKMKRLLHTISGSLMLSALVLMTGVAQAFDGGVTGQISIIQGATSLAVGNLPFRVFLQGSPTLCGNTNTWAYLSDTDSNYKVNVALLLSTKAQGLTVTVYSNRDTNGYCQIGFISVG